MDTEPKKCRLLFLGESEVGKTSILLRFVDGTFSGSDIATIGLDYKIKDIKYENKPIKLELWDSAGQERFRAITKSYFKAADGFIFVYDISNKQSFEGLKKWIMEAQQSTYIKGHQIIIVGNKIDLEEYREVGKNDIEALAKKYKAQCIETSAKTGEGIDEIFSKIVESLINGEKDRSNDQLSKRDGSMKLSDINDIEKSGEKCKC